MKFIHDEKAKHVVDIEVLLNRGLDVDLAILEQVQKHRQKVRKKRPQTIAVEGENMPRSSRRRRSSPTELDAATLNLVKAMYKEMKRLVREVIRLRQLEASGKRLKAAKKKERRRRVR